MMNDGFGLISEMPFAYFDHDTSLLRMCLPSDPVAQTLGLTDAYAAGLLDGEGCFYLGHVQNRMGPRIALGMSDKAEKLIYGMQKEYGGAVQEARPPKDQYARILRWTAHGSQAVECLRRLLPYLQLKREQAELLIKFWEEVPRKQNGNVMWSDSVRTFGWEMDAKIKILNKRGPIVAPHADVTWTPSKEGSIRPSEEFLGTFPNSGSMRNGQLFQHVPWVPHTCDEDCSRWPTPVANDDNKSPAAHLAMKARMKPTPRYKITSLSVMLRQKAGRTNGLANPAFSLWLMGFPENWLSLPIEQSAIPWSPKLANGWPGTGYPTHKKESDEPA